MPARLSPNLRAISVLGFFLATSGSALAEEGACISAFEAAQRLRKEGKLLAASEALITCANSSCQSFISRECTAWYGEVQASLPTVALSARKDGQLLREVRVYIDGALVSEQSDGRSVPVDPGLHEFKFEIEGAEPSIVKELVIEGEKNKPITAMFSTPTAEVPPVVEQAPARPPAPEPEPRPSPPILSYVLAGAGVLAVGGGVALRLIGSSEFDDFEESCKPKCSQKEVDKTILKYTLSDISFGVGAAALVGAGVLYFVHGSSSSSRVDTGFTVAPTRGGAAALWSGRF